MPGTRGLARGAARRSSGCAAIATTIAAAAGLNPLLCGLVVTLAVDAVIHYPVQTAANLLAYESGYFAAADVRRLGLGMLVLTIVVVMLVLPWWALLALPLAGTA